MSARSSVAPKEWDDPHIMWSAVANDWSGVDNQIIIRLQQEFKTKRAKHDKILRKSISARTDEEKETVSDFILVRDNYRASTELKFTQQNGDSRRGVFVNKKIQKGGFIDFYTGKVKLREDPDPSKYLTALYSSPDLMLDVDAELVGSRARYITDTRISQKPVNSTFFMCWNSCDQMPTVAVFAESDIEIGEEVILDYGEDYWLSNTVAEMSATQNHDGIVSESSTTTLDHNVTPCQELYDAELPSKRPVVLEIPSTTTLSVKKTPPVEVSSVTSRLRPKIVQKEQNTRELEWKDLCGKFRKQFEDVKKRLEESNRRNEQMNNKMAECKRICDDTKEKLKEAKNEVKRLQSANRPEKSTGRDEEMKRKKEVEELKAELEHKTKRVKHYKSLWESTIRN